MRRLSLLLVIAVSASLASVGIGRADESYGPFKMMQTSVGEVLTDANGMTLYTFDKDKEGISNCTGECAEYWPPAPAPANAKPVDDDLTLVTRADGTLQWAEEGKPLYTYVNDKKPGDVTGDGKNGVWHVVRDD
ncbi:MAG: COG4315 family predicted lipoprotein [Dongiaceae bacterium]